MNVSKEPIRAGVLPKRGVLGLGLSIGGFSRHVDAIIQMAKARQGAYVCCVNAHMTVETRRTPDMRRVVNEADMATADGMPVLIALRTLAGEPQERVAGNDLMPALLEAAAREGVNVFLYGGRPEVLDRIAERIARQVPHLRLVGRHAPPFRPLTDEEMGADAARIEASGAGLVLVSLGCPKQERWMAAMRPRVNAVMIGLGGAFLLYAGMDTRAPKWMRDLSLEWLYRFALEPGRLWKRYLVTNTWFLAILLVAMVRRPFGGPTPTIPPVLGSCGGAVSSTS